VNIHHFDHPEQAVPSYSQAVRGGDLIVTSGHLGAEPGGESVPFAVQAERALTSLLETITTAGGSPGTILRINGYLADLDDFPAYNEVYRRIVVAPRPARTTVQIARFFEPTLVEVDAIALAVQR